MNSHVSGGCDCRNSSMMMHAMIIILLVFIIWKLIRVERLAADYSGDYVGSGLPNTIYDSGADLRRLGQVFSSTDQGSTNTIYNAEIKAAQRFP
jgi:hypothetical protein